MEPNEKLKKAIKEYKNGNVQAFDVLYHESEKYVYTCIYNAMCGNDNFYDAAEEIMQNTYIEISRKITQLENDDRFLQWAGTIANRKCSEYIKKNKRYLLVEEEDTTFENLADNENCIPESILQDREKQRLIREIIEKELTQMQKLCIIAFYYNQQKQSEIAQELGIPENTVKTNLSRAKAKIEKGILEVEKRDGIRLHSIAPFMLLLFKEEVEAAVVPKEITKNVLASVTGAAGSMGAATTTATGATATKTIAGKLAAVSLKAKIIGGLATVGVAATVGGIAYTTHTTNTISEIEVEKELIWEKVYKGYILNNEEALGFDLNDFDEDGIPEMVVKTQSKSKDVDVYRVENESIIRVRAISGVAYSNLEDAQETWDDIRIGYGMNYDEVIKLEYGKGVRNDTGKEYKVASYALFQYENNNLETISSDMDTLEREFNEIQYSEINEAAIKERFEEFKKEGNRKRAYNNAQQKEENDVIDSIEAEVETQALPIENIEKESEEGTVETQSSIEKQEIELTESEKEKLRILAQFFTATRWGENLAGEEILPTAQNVCDFIGRVANENGEYNQWVYDKYLPIRIAEEEFRQVYTKEHIKEYAKSVFNVELPDIDSPMLWEENGNYVAMEAQSSSVDKCEITKLMQEGDTYVVTGTHAFGEYEEVESPEPSYMAPYMFTMTLEKNTDSPFGYTLKGIQYQYERDMQVEKMNTLKEILIFSEGYPEYYGDGADLSHVWFAIADIDQDGSGEIFLANCYDNKHFATIYNILKYDEQRDVVTDMDGNRKYEAIGTGQHLYETGILRTCTEGADNNTYFWNLLTGEVWHGSQFKQLDQTVSRAESPTCAELICSDGRIVTGEEGDALYKSLMVGEEIPLKWYEATIENVNTILK